MHFEAVFRGVIHVVIFQFVSLFAIVDNFVQLRLLCRFWYVVNEAARLSGRRTAYSLINPDREDLR